MTGSIERFLEARASDRVFPGAAWSVVVRGRTLGAGGVGSTTFDPPAEPVTVRTIFDLASLTKPLATAPLLVLAEQERKLDLHAPVGRILGELTHSPWASTSLFALATHASGLPAWRPLYLAASTREGYLDEIARCAPAVAVGRTLYSDLGYILLGAVLERVWDRSLDTLFLERIAGPLSLHHTGFGSGRVAFAAAAPTERGNSYERALAGAAGAEFDWRGEIPRGEVHDTNAHGLGGVAGHAGLFGSTEEVTRLSVALLDEWPLGLGDRARARLLRVAPRSEGRTVGMVAATHASAARGVLPGTAVGHTGFTGTSVWLDPEQETVYVLLTNRVHPRVPQRDFRWTRRGFHRLSRTLVRHSA